MARIQSETLKKLIRRALHTRSEEIGCETCFESLDRFVELELDGKDASQAFPLIKYHLELCTGCAEEYQALLAALNELQTDSSADLPS
ncbi:MAG: hypothetical protein KIS80_06480 [Anaerolineales bacterium]|nr:hypothetical protein [Anaerolineales bacterium]